MAKEFKTPKENRITHITVFQIVMFVILFIYAISIILPLIFATNWSMSPDDQLSKLGYLSPFWKRTGMIIDGKGNLVMSKNYYELYNWQSVFQQYYGVIQKLNNGKPFNGLYNIDGIQYGRSNIYVGFFGMFGNTMAYSLGGALSMATCMVTVSYLCSKYRNFFSKFIYAVVLFMMMVPILGGNSSTIELIRKIHIYDTYYGYLFLKFSFGGVYFLTYHAFFSSLPDAYNEAAEIDGASQLWTMVTIIIPLASKIILTTTLIQFVGFYNDYATALLYMPTHPTLAYGVYTLTVDSVPVNYVVGYKEDGTELINTFRPTDTSARMAAIMILAFPMVTLFMIAKDKLMGNLSVGGIKG